MATVKRGIDYYYDRALLKAALEPMSLSMFMGGEYQVRTLKDRFFGIFRGEWPSKTRWVPDPPPERTGETYKWRRYGD